MPFDGSGTFNRVMRWQNDRDAAVKIRADRHDQEDDNLAAGLTACLTKDGQSQPSANIPMNGKKLINLGAPTAATDAATKGYVDGKTTYSVPLVLSGAGANGRLTFTGATGAVGLEFEAADLFFGGSGTSWIWNDKADGTGTTTMQLTDTGTLSLVSIDAGVASGPVLTLDRQSPSPAVNDVLGTTTFRGRNSAGGTVGYGSIYAQILDPVSGQETAQLVFRRMVAGALTTGIVVHAAGVTLPQDLAVTGNTTLGGTLAVTGTLASGNASITGNMVASGHVQGANNFIASSGTGTFANLSSGTELRFRPVAYNSGVGQMVLAANGNLSVAGDVSLGGSFASGSIAQSPWTVRGSLPSAGSSYVAFNGSTGTRFGFVGAASASNNNITLNADLGSLTLKANTTMSLEATAISTTASLSITGTLALSAQGTFSSGLDILGNTTVGATTAVASNANPGHVFGGAGHYYSKKVGTTNQGHIQFYNNAAVTPTLVGQIMTNGSATAYNTSSDEGLKEFIGEYDPLKAIDIIRRDPVRDFNWKNGDGYAVGWGAQTSYEVSPDLASPPPPPGENEIMGAAPGEPGYFPWGMDQSKRTPYLWAALTWALDRIDELLARVETLEGGAA